MMATRWVLALQIVLVGLSGAVAAAPVTSPPAPQSRVAQPRRGPGQEQGKPEYPEIRIAAVVNDDVISVADLSSRIRMVLLSTSIPDTLDARKRLATQVLRQLIDEKLQIQEAKRHNITATEAEIKKAIASIEQQNNMHAGQLDEVLKANGIDHSALTQQVTASIMWAKIIRQLAADTDPVGDAEVDDALKRLKQNDNEPRSRVAEIFLAVDNPKQDAEELALAQRLIDQMKQGARFSAMAQQFSQSATASVGGDLGWIQPDAMSPPLAKVVASMRPGELSTPIRTPAGYYILLVLDRRNGSTVSADDTVLHIVQVVFPLPAQASEEARRAALAEAAAARTGAKSCADMLKIGREKAPQLSSEGDLRASQISPTMRGVVLGLGVGQPSEPIMQKNGVGVIMVCKKTDPKPTVTTRDDMFQTLMRERLDTLARRYMRDLRRSAYVDVRV
jgi:peptidyl-prolyl cis-trans isomerase SurA